MDALLLLRGPLAERLFACVHDVTRAYNSAHSLELYAITRSEGSIAAMEQAANGQKYKLSFADFGIAVLVQSQ